MTSGQRVLDVVFAEHCREGGGSSQANDGSVCRQHHVWSGVYGDQAYVHSDRVRSGLVSLFSLVRQPELALISL